MYFHSKASSLIDSMSPLGEYVILWTDAIIPLTEVVIRLTEALFPLTWSIQIFTQSSVICCEVSFCLHLNKSNLEKHFYFSLCASVKSTERMNILNIVKYRLGMASLRMLQQSGIDMTGIDMVQGEVPPTKQ